MKPQPDSADREQGFSMVEFLLSSLVLLVVAASTFGLLGQTQRTADSQAQTQTVTENARIAMETLTRIILQGGNDPRGVGFQAIVLTSPAQLEVRSDLTGSVIPDQGDPDGDVSDAGEDVTIQYDAAARTIQLLSGPNVQPIACNISAFSMQYFNRLGALTTNGNEVTRVRITLTATSPTPDPQTRNTFSMQLTSDVQIASRQ